MNAYWVAFIAIGVATLVASTLQCAAQNAPAGPQAAVAPSSQSAHSSGASPNESRPDFAGAWKLNRDESDDPQQKLQQSGGFGGGRMGRRRGGRSGNGTMMSGLSQLMIDEASSRVKVSDANGRVIAQYPVTGDTSSNALNSPRTEWKGSQLVATAEGRRGGSITRTFDLSPDGKQLYMTTKIENPRLQAPVAIRFVYDHAAASE